MILAMLKVLAETDSPTIIISGGLSAISTAVLIKVATTISETMDGFFGNKKRRNRREFIGEDGCLFHHRGPTIEKTMEQSLKISQETSQSVSSMCASVEIIATSMRTIANKIEVDREVDRRMSEQHHNKT